MHSTPPTATDRPRFVVGTMTGTSIDGELDAALVAIDGRGTGMRARFVTGISHPLGALADALRRAASQEPMTAGAFAALARAFGEAHADALAALCEAAGTRPDLAVLHGQTVFHAPPLTWQLLDPWPVAVRLGCRVRHDLRSANVASGGQGAPITPIADAVLFGDGTRTQVVMNLGGFINATVLPPRGSGRAAIRGFDACACNHLLDRVAQTRLGTRFDADGAAAARGRCDATLTAQIADALAPATGSAGTRRSLGTGDEAGRLVERTRGLPAEDACRTIVEAIAEAAMRIVRSEAAGGFDRILIAGGSARHAALAEALAARAGVPVERTDRSHGVPVHMREAAEIAILGALADDGVRYSLPQVTGADSAIPESAVLLSAVSAETTED